MITPKVRSALPWFLLTVFVCSSWFADDAGEHTGTRVHYLEIVTPEVDATCAAYARIHGMTFGDPEPTLGNARTAQLAGGGMVAVRAPMRATEEPVVRAYLLVDDIEAAAKTAAEAGGEIAHPPWEIPGRGMFAIYIQGGIEHALWKL